MRDLLTLGVEEELQVVDDSTLQPAKQGFDVLMRGATDEIKEHMKPEVLQPVVECYTDVCATVDEVSRQTMMLRATAASLARRNGLKLIAAGTHPRARWYDQKATVGERYHLVEDVLQDVFRSILIYGLHVHVGIPDEARRIDVMNQVRTFLPHILALSANSPFWMGRCTGYSSFRTIVWSPFPLAGVPDAYQSLTEFDQFCVLLKQCGSVDGIRRIWWDVRPHHTLPTLEFRIADMLTRHEDMVALVAFIQALVKLIIDRIERGDPLPVLSTPLINENKWRAARWGLHGKLIDPIRGAEVPTVELISETITMVEETAEELGTSEYLRHLRDMAALKHLYGADRQLTVYERRHDLNEVTEDLARETLEGVAKDMAMPLVSRSPFGWLKLRVRRESVHDVTPVKV